MKRFYTVLMLILSFGFVQAQTLETAHIIGATVDNQKVEVKGEQIVFGAMIGAPMISTTAVINPPTANDEGANAMLGFPYIGYFPEIFDQNIFASKGYFGNLVQLQWDAVSDDIDQFRIYRKEIGEEGDSLLVGVLGPTDFFFKDETIDYGVVYKYTVFARGLADDLRLEYYNYVESDGFAFPTGSVSGQVKFEGGTAVKDVSVVATTEGNLSGKAMAFDADGEFLKVVHGADDDELEINDGFTVQMWTKFKGNSEGVLFKKGDNYQLTYDGSQLKFNVGSESLVMDFLNPVDSFFHVSAIFDQGNELKLITKVSETRRAQKSQASIVMPSENVDNIVFGGDGTTSGQFVGLLDEIRLWEIPLSEEDVENNYYRYIAGSSEGLVGYWRLDMGIGNDFYDFSRKGSTFFENHGEVIKASSTSEIPLNSQLAFRGLTDEDGNYTVSGFPYESTGSLYKFTALKTYHEFDPPQQTRFVGPSESIHNEINFTDVSSFPVTGTINYKNSFFPVQGVSILIDGQPAVDQDGKLIVSDHLGRFNVDVPIGWHTLRMSMPNHVFTSDGRFPAATETDDAPLFNFQEPVNGLEFIDETLVKVAGRVVGGPIEEAKKLGFAKSINNIGNATISMETQKGYDITNNTSGVNQDIQEINAGAELNTNVNLNTRFITIKPDTETGEFVAYLPPEQYLITSIVAGDYNFDDSFNTTLDLRSAFAEELEIVNDTVPTSINGQAIEGAQPLKVEDYEGSSTFIRNDTLFTVGIDTFRIQKRHDFIYRTVPSIDVVNANQSGFFGEAQFKYSDEVLGIEEDVPLYDESSGTYAFGHPIFNQRSTYDFDIKLFERYVNADNGDAVDQVPVIDGRIEVINELSLSNDKVVLELDDQGKTRYAFRAGIPNRSVDNNNRDNDFSKTMNVTAFSGKNGAIKTVWRAGDPFRGIIFGSQPFGNNFVTTGPNIVDYILRDPPGSNSSASIAKGETVSTSSSFSVTDKTTDSQSFGLSLGLGVTTFVGVGAGVINEVDDKAALDAGFSVSSEYTKGTEREEVVTLERTISTSDDPLFVGEAGDVFIGRSTNIVYGAAGFVELIPRDQCETCGEKEFQEFRIGTKVGMNLGSQFNTGFAFSQFHIENNLIPNLKKIRDGLLTYTADPNAVAATDKPLYISKLPNSDPRFGKSNTDDEVWGDQASNYTNDGPSYVIKFPSDFAGEKSDTIAFYNKQISSWEFWLAQNEKQKVEAALEDNVSFESGATYQQSVTVEKIESTSFSTDFTIDSSIAATLGVTVNDIGFSATTSLEVSSSSSRSGTSSEQRSTTSTFTLSDGDIGDAYTVDVKKPSDGFGTVFSTRGGQTACPYEPETLTRYFEPGKHVLNAATQRREGPVITAGEAVIANVPENRSADFSINLSTDSETGEPFSYTLFVDPESNPNGAELSINGDPIGNGLSFLVKPGETITQTLSLSKGRDDVFNYEDIRILFVSQCQFDPAEPQADLADTVHVSAFFVPGCSDIEISNPGDNWVLNTNAPQENVLNATIGGYDLNLSDFTRFQFQYKAVGAQSWITDMTFYNSKNVSQEEYDKAQGPKQWVNEPSVVYAFDMGGLPDQEYEIRSVAYCDVGPGLTYETPSDVLRGIKDTQRPQAFGAPQPADGILSANDEIRIRFNEDIVEGKLTPNNFSIKGVLNNTAVRNSVSVNLDGLNNYVRIEDGLRLGQSSFTIEFKLKRNSINKEVVVFSKGYTESDQIEIGFTEDNKLFVQFGEQKISSSLTMTDVDNFNHYAVAYNAEENELYAYVNDKYFIEQASLNNVIDGTGPISLGKSNIRNDRHTDGNLLDLRIWNRFKSLADVFAAIQTQLNGIEIGLVGYWPFDEAYGRLATDRARFRNATLFAEWSVLPVGHAYSFDGVDDFLQINTSSTVVIGKDNDFTIEMWLNGAKEQTNSVLFSSGKGTSGTESENQFEDPAKSMSIGFNGAGALYLASNGEINILLSNAAKILDNDWHHFALSVSRTGSAIAYLDGAQIKSFSSDVIGSFFRNKMTIGARTSKVNLNDENQDRFFKGLIDEFRIWNVARSSSSILLDRNARLTGDEFGLRAYYPFDEYKESQGIQQLNATLQDQFNNSDGPNGGVATAFGDGDFVSNTPNITLARPVKDVPYSFLVNGDELIITPHPSARAAIERSVLEISVKNVEDVNGNRLASPITFTAFVNRNLVKWNEESIEIEKAPNESYSFDFDIINLGGNEENYNISNLPPWLTVEPQTGTLDPLSSKTLSFTINSGLNNGYYNEDIFLTTDFGFNEKLNIDLKVLEETPDWILDKTNFEFSMSIVAQLEIDGIISRDHRDVLSAFVNDELRGVASLQYVAELDQYMAFMDIFSNGKDGDAIVEFRAFDADKGIEFRQLTGLTAKFEAQKTYGTPSSPTLLSTGELVAEKLTFSQGFSWRSFNLNSSVLDKTNDLLAGIEAQTNDRVTSANFIDIYTEGLGWLGSITNNGGYDPESYYLFYLKNGGEVDLVGTRVSTSTVINVQPGFNRIGFIPSFVLSVEEAFSSLEPNQGDIVRGQFEFALYEEGLGWIGSLENLQPGQGYLYYSNAASAKSFNYPSVTFLSGNIVPREGDEVDMFANSSKKHAPEWSLNPHDFPANMSIVGKLATENSEEYVIGAFDEHGLVGISHPKMINGEFVFFLTPHGGNEIKELNFKAFNRTTGQVIVINEIATYQPNTLLGRLDREFIFTLGNELSEGELSLTAFPNPFEQLVEIDLGSKLNNVTMEIHAIDGKLLKSEVYGTKEPVSVISWNGRSAGNIPVDQGTYIIRIRHNGGVQSVKVIKR